MRRATRFVGSAGCRNWGEKTCLEQQPYLEARYETGGFFQFSHAISWQIVLLRGVFLCWCDWPGRLVA